MAVASTNPRRRSNLGHPNRRPTITSGWHLNYYLSLGKLVGYYTMAALLINARCASARHAAHTSGITAELYPQDVRQRPSAEKFYIFAPTDSDYDAEDWWYDQSAPQPLPYYDWQHKRHAHNILEQLLDRINDELGRRRPESTSDT